MTTTTPVDPIPRPEPEADRDVPAVPVPPGVLGAAIVLGTKAVLSAISGIVAFAAADRGRGLIDPVVHDHRIAGGLLSLALAGCLLAVTFGLVRLRSWARASAIAFEVVLGVLAVPALAVAPIWALIAIAISVLVVFGLTSPEASAAFER